MEVRHCGGGEAERPTEVVGVGDDVHAGMGGEGDESMVATDDDEVCDSAADEVEGCVAECVVSRIGFRLDEGQTPPLEIDQVHVGA